MKRLQAKAAAFGARLRLRKTNGRYPNCPILV
jgi:hypothetical protein